MKRFKNCTNPCETSGEAEPLKAGEGPHRKKPVLDSSDDERKTEHGPDGCQSLEHSYSHEGDRLNGAGTRQLRPRVPKRASARDGDHPSVKGGPDKEGDGGVRPQARKRRRTVVCQSHSRHRR
ncbi:hypothetical protein QBC46DRAFT_342501 [Diplogelasinospora grovesii]|uniref:Uncharacterized protein n=1 Tax=Diplogelasinospora grovesii TaxID=303347 RepID=A0AAN6N798_9PEZI|nr:hypothetical protein QBC46DRAFT_342501 [Diplogelasinospora grovesii]